MPSLSTQGMGASVQVALCHPAQAHEMRRIQIATMRMSTTILTGTEVATAVTVIVVAAAMLEVLKETLSRLNLIACEKVLRIFHLKWYKN